MALGKTVKQLLAETDSAELTEWRAYYAIEPFGELIADQRHGLATSVLANVNRDSKKKPDAYVPADFIPWHESHRMKAEPMLLSDPAQHARLVKRTLFGRLLDAAKRK